MNNDILSTDRGNILVVDDTPANLRLLAGILNSKGYKVRPVPSGELALSAAKGMPPDLILLDIMMPEMNGYEAMTEIRKIEHHKNLPMIAVTAKAMAGDREKCMEAGATDYITKPVDTDQLLALMRVLFYK